MKSEQLGLERMRAIFASSVFCMAVEQWNICYQDLTGGVLRHRRVFHRDGVSRCRSVAPIGWRFDSANIRTQCDWNNPHHYSLLQVLLRIETAVRIGYDPRAGGGLVGIFRRLGREMAMSDL